MVLELESLAEEKRIKRAFRKHKERKKHAYLHTHYTFDGSCTFPFTAQKHIVINIHTSSHVSLKTFKKNMEGTLLHYYI
jgi:hypothetical protein